MASYDYITELIQFDNHKDEIKAIFTKHFDATSLSFNKNSIETVLSYIDIPIKLKSTILNKYESVVQAKDALEAFKFIRLITVEKAHPSLWYLNKEPEYQKDDISKGTFSLYSILIIASYMIDTYHQAQIDESHIAFNLKHLQGYIKEYYENHKEIGITNYTWCIYLASLGLIHLHTLHFMHHVFTDNCIVLKEKKTNTKVVMALGGIHVRRDGQINHVNKIDEYSFTTTYKETKTSFIGNRVNPYGAITNDLLILPKHDYELLLQPGDFVIDYHIPTGKGYTIENTKESFKQAVDFFSKLYPDHNYKAFWCLSWLSSPQIPLFIKKRPSNIHLINEESYTFPATNGEESIFKFVFGDEQINLDEITPQTSLEQGIIDYSTSRKKINCGVFLYFIEDLDEFGNQLYRFESDYLEFIKLNN